MYPGIDNEYKDRNACAWEGHCACAATHLRVHSIASTQGTQLGCRPNSSMVLTSEGWKEWEQNKRMSSSSRSTHLCSRFSKACVRERRERACERETTRAEVHKREGGRQKERERQRERETKKANMQMSVRPKLQRQAGVQGEESKKKTEKDRNREVEVYTEERHRDRETQVHRQKASVTILLRQLCSDTARANLVRAVDHFKDSPPSPLSHEPDSGVQPSRQSLESFKALQTEETEEKKRSAQIEQQSERLCTW